MLDSIKLLVYNFTVVSGGCVYGQYGKHRSEENTRYASA